MRTLITIILIALSGFVGYYIGNNQGYEKAVFDSTTPKEQVSSQNQDETLQSARTALVGNWRSNDDARFTREFKADETAIDLYDNGDGFDKTALSWSVFNSGSTDAGYTGEYQDGVAYLHMSNGKNDLYFKIIKVTSEELSLFRISEGDILLFKKIK